MSRIFRYFNRVITRECIREQVERLVRFRYIQEVQVDSFKDTYLINLYTTRVGYNIGVQGTFFNSLREQIMNKLGLDKLNLNILPVHRSSGDSSEPVSARIIMERIGQMILNRVNYKRAVYRTLQELSSLGILGARIELRGPLKKIRREEFIQDIGNYRIASGDTTNFEVSQGSFTLPGGVVGVTVTVVHRQGNLPDKIILLEDRLDSLLAEQEPSEGATEEENTEPEQEQVEQETGEVPVEPTETE